MCQDVHGLVHFLWRRYINTYISYNHPRWLSNYSVYFWPSLTISYLISVLTSYMYLEICAQQLLRLWMVSSVLSSMRFEHFLFAVYVGLFFLRWFLFIYCVFYLKTSKWANLLGKQGQTIQVFCGENPRERWKVNEMFACCRERIVFGGYKKYSFVSVCSFVWI